MSKRTWEDITLGHIGTDEEQSVVDQVTEALRRVCLLVDDERFDSKGAVTLKLKVKRVEERGEDGEVIGHQLAIDSSVERKDPHRLNNSLEVRCEHENTPGFGRGLVRARQLSLLGSVGEV